MRLYWEVVRITARRMATYRGATFAGVVGWRLAELLPLQDEQRQALLQIDDPHHRLYRLLALLP